MFYRQEERRAGSQARREGGCQVPTGEQEEASPALPGPALACPPTFDRPREKGGDDEIAGQALSTTFRTIPPSFARH